MARDTKWCQNPKCPEKKNTNQNWKNLVKSRDIQILKYL